MPNRFSNISRRCSLTAQGGYTLIEIIVVMMIISLLTAGVIPVFQGTLTGVRHDRASRDFIALMKYAQETAISEATEYRFCLDHDEGQYWLMRAVIDDKGRTTYENVDDAYGVRRTLPEGIELKRPDARRDRSTRVHFVAFYPSGSCDHATVELESRDRDKVVIRTRGRLGQFDVDDR